MAPHNTRGAVATAAIRRIVVWIAMAALVATMVATSAAPAGALPAVGSERTAVPGIKQFNPPITSASEFQQQAACLGSLGPNDSLRNCVFNIDNLPFGGF
jgi:hypothetical protein